MSKKIWSIFYSNLLYEIVQDFLDIQFYPARDVDFTFEGFIEYICAQVFINCLLARKDPRLRTRRVEAAVEREIPRLPRSGESRVLVLPADQEVVTLFVKKFTT